MANLIKANSTYPLPLNLLKERIGLFFLLFILQTSLYRQFNSKDLNFWSIILNILYLGTSYYLLSEKLRGQFLKDYFVGKVVPKKDHHKDLLIQGQIIQSDLEEDQKEERFLRVAGLSNTVKRRVLIIAYLCLFFLFRYLTSHFNQEIPLLEHIIPLTLGLVALLTTTYGQLLALPLLSLITGILQLPSDQKLQTTELALLSVSLILAFWSLRLVLDLPNMKSPSNPKNPQRTAKDNKASSLLFEIKTPAIYLITSLWLINALIPNKEDVKPIKKEDRALERINHQLGKTIKRPATNIIKRREDIRNLKGSGNFLQIPLNLPASSFKDSLKSISDQLDFYKNLFKSDFFKNLDVPEMEKNILINGQKELHKDYQNLQDQLFNKEQYGAEEIQATLDFLKKLEDLQSDLTGIGLSKGHPSMKDLPSAHQSFNKAFEKAIKQDLNPFQKLLEEEQSSIDKKNDTSEYADLLESLKMPGDKGRPNKDNIKEQFGNVQKLKQRSFALMEKNEKEESFLIDPKFLERILDHLKILIFILIGIAIFNFIKKLFTKEKVLSSNNDEIQKLKKSFLKKIPYQSMEEEIYDRYNKFLEATKNIYFGNEEEPPPPKVLEIYLKKNSNQNEKALNYLTEVFSRSFYGKQQFPAKTLTKYRKAYRHLIKSL